MKCIAINQEKFQKNVSIHNINTSNKNQLHRPNFNLSCFEKSKFYGGIKISAVYHVVWQSLKMKWQNLK
jgi:wobble nucleotide-excising tRNase